MREFTAILHRGHENEGGFWATCLGVTGANDQGETEAACLESLADAVRLMIDVEREQALKEDPSAREIPLAA